MQRHNVKRPIFGDKKRLLTGRVNGRQVENDYWTWSGDTAGHTVVPKGSSHDSTQYAN